MTPRALSGSLLALCCAACGELGVTVEVSAGADVPALDQLRLEVAQGSTFIEQTFELAGAKLPQSIAVVSKGLTRGNVDVTVQGLAGGRVEAVARVSAELRPATSAQRVTVVLARLCPTAGGCGCTPNRCDLGAASKSCGLLDDGCGGRRECGGCPAAQRCEGGVCRAAACVPRTCAELGASCGLTLDGCGNTLDCGRCDAGSSCGGGGTPNVCGAGPCTPRTRCDAGLDCGSQSDGCGGLVSCGTCPSGAQCGADGAPNRCPCVPLQSCPPDKQCGTWPNGCNTADLSCGSCTLPQTCAGAGQANRCGCTPQATCPALSCGQQPDGCGGTFDCGAACPGGRACSSPDGGPSRCSCTPPLAECNGACVDLRTDAQHCGACGRVCPGGQACRNGECPCVDAGSNADGHCCPPGWVLSGYLENPGFMRCFKGPFDAGSELQAFGQCRSETLSDYGRAVSALASAGRNTLPSTAAPFGACGTYWAGGNGAVLDVENGMITANRTCTAACTGSSCACTTCNCLGLSRGCAQRYYCVMDPLVVRVAGPCTFSGECPPGKLCSAGNCVDAGQPFCVLDIDCGGAGGNCQPRGANAATGLCE